MLDQIIKSVADNKELTGLIGTGIAFVASELIGKSKLQSTGLIHLLWNIGKTVVQASIKKEGK